jgi:hypothetical protein
MNTSDALPFIVKASMKKMRSHVSSLKPGTDTRVGDTLMDGRPRSTAVLLRMTVCSALSSKRVSIADLLFSPSPARRVRGRRHWYTCLPGTCLICGSLAGGDAEESGPHCCVISQCSCLQCSLNLGAGPLSHFVLSLCVKQIRQRPLLVARARLCCTVMDWKMRHAVAACCLGHLFSMMQLDSASFPLVSARRLLFASFPLLMFGPLFLSTRLEIKGCTRLITRCHAELLDCFFLLSSTADNFPRFGLRSYQTAS